MAPVRPKVFMEINGDYSLENNIISKQENYDSAYKILKFYSVKRCAVAPKFKSSKLGPSSELNESHPSRR